MPGTPEARTSRSAPTTRRAFTIVELLVVIGVIAILIGILLPTLAAARRAAIRTVSMSQMRQITLAALAYTYDFGERWPVTPSKMPDPGDEDLVQFDSFVWGGKTSSDYWKTYADGSNYHAVEDRLVNPYLYSDTDMIDPPDGRLELPMFQCPADVRSFQRVYWRTRPPAPIPPPDPISSYDDVGTSYHINLNWWYRSSIPNESTLRRWIRTEPIFRRGGLGGPSRFVWLYDQTMDVVCIRGDSIVGEHGELNRAKMAFQDGHVDYQRVQPRVSKTADYTLLLD